MESASGKIILLIWYNKYIFFKKNIIDQNNVFIIKYNLNNLIVLFNLWKRTSLNQQMLIIIQIILM